MTQSDFAKPRQPRPATPEAAGSAGNNIHVGTSENALFYGVVYSWREFVPAKSQIPGDEDICQNRKYDDCRMVLEERLYKTRALR
jgi:hypothetical protein